MKLPSITIIRDTREQKGWNFDPEEKVAGKIQILGTEVGTLDAGDYTIKGMEHIVRIERKFGFCELFGNMTPVSNRERFEREMEKLRPIPYKYLVIESSINDDILGLSVPQIYKGPPGSAVLKWIFELQVEFGIIPVFTGSCGKRVVKQIFEAIIRKTS